MISFEGALSSKCKKNLAQRIAQIEGLLFAFTTLTVSAIILPWGIIKGTWMYSIIIVLLFLIITIIAFIPPKRFLSLKTNIKIIFDEDTITKKMNISSISRPLSKVKKVVDMGEYYCLVFRMEGIRSSWICEKELIKQGTLKEFESLFTGKIKRKSKKK